MFGGRLGRIGLGGAPIGNLFSEVSDEDAAATLDAAWEAGIRYFDTAPHYGLGLSERRLGAGLADRPRAEVCVSTKVGRLLVADPAGADVLDDEGFAVPATWRREWDFSADGVRRSLESSLERLGLDRVDVVYIHDPDTEQHRQQAVREAFPALAAWRDEGVVSAIGYGMNHSNALAWLVSETDPDVVLVAGRYSLLDQAALDDLLPICVERGVAVVAAGVFNSGLLATERPVDGATFDYQPADRGLIERAGRIAEVCEAHGVSLPAAAVQFPLGHPAVVNVTIGARSPAEVDRDVRLAGMQLPAELWAQLRAEGLIRSDAPLTPGDRDQNRDEELSV
jgi:D-threo-aldose 1-dehydrogenase